MESIQDTMSSMKEIFQKRMAEFEAELPKAQGAASVVSLSAEYALFKAFISDTMSNLQQQIDVLSRAVDSIEMRSRRKMLLLHGVPEPEEQMELSEVLTSAVNKHMQPPITSEDIRRCHRMGRPSADHKPRPIVVKFHNVAVRDSLWFAKTKFKGSGITASEFLTRERHQTFMAARQRFGIAKCWTKEGYIYVIAANEVRHRITNISELNKIEVPSIEKPPAPAKPTIKSKRTAAQKK